MEQPCALCLESWPPGELNRMHALDVCDACRHDPCPRVRAWATLHVEEQWQTVKSGRSSELAQIISARAWGGVDLPVVTFGRGVPSWLEWFSGRTPVRVGDPLFDRAVAVYTRDPKTAARLLAHEGVQCAVLAAVTMDADLRLTNNEVRIRSQSKEARAPGELGVLVVSILRHARTVLGDL